MKSVNLQTLWDTSDGDADFAWELAELYLEKTTEQIASLRAALNERSALKVSNIAHRCAGGSLACGVVNLGSLFKQLEQLGRDGRLEEAERLSAAIDDEFVRVHSAMRALLTRARPSGNQP